MKIAIFTDTFPPEVNGVAFCAQSLAEEAGRENEVLVIAPKNNEGNGENDNYRIIRFASIPLKAYAGMHIALPNIIKLNKVIKFFNPDVIHIHSPGPLGIAGVVFSKIRNIPLVGTYHSLFSESVVYVSPLKRLKKFLPKKSGNNTIKALKSFKNIWKEIFDLEKKKRKETGLQKLTWKVAINFYDNCDKVIVPSITIKKIVDNKGLKGKTVHVPNGIRLDSFLSQRKSYKTQNEILYVGRIVFDKKVDIVIEAFNEAIKEIPQLKLKIVGDGPALPSLKKLAKRLKLLGKVEFTGRVDREHLPQIYSSADCLVTASTIEVQPLVLLEAMSSGLPVVGVKKYGIADLVVHGKNGFLAKPGKYKDISRYIVKVINDSKLRRELGKNAINTAFEHDVSNTTEKTIQLYSSLV